ncbi:MgtC/SapB family protein [Sinosporangium siamense]|uniref:Magnesium transport MgtC family protein n=1 Tax=Sinosporangium siamense TaxID=1367973 RepID=A0A919RP93_9ACTN|nr:MgtC/SapB family protein [Sinosporangium siamense]GII96515.1 putative magnesium transport MgtC family protein [Sinosporangium siamense]
MGVASAAGGLAGQGWVQLGELGLALVLSTAIGMEREIRQKSAGLRTHTLVGFAAALIMLVSKYGFGDVLGDHVTLDPSRVAAQIVSGIGFIGAGIIFVRQDAVHGLTTAAIIWLTTAVGMAAGAGLWLLAIAVTAGHFLVVFGFTPLAARLPRSKFTQSRLHLVYHDRRGALRHVLSVCTDHGFVIAHLLVEREHERKDPRLVSIWILLQGPGKIDELATVLADIDGVISVSSTDLDAAIP